MSRREGGMESKFLFMGGEDGKDLIEIGVKGKDMESRWDQESNSAKETDGDDDDDDDADSEDGGELQRLGR